MYIKQFITVCFIGLCMLACKPSKENDPQPETPKEEETKIAYAPLSMHLHIFVNGIEAESYSNDPINDGVGRKVSLSFAQFYLSGIELVKQDGSILPLKRALVLKSIDNPTYFLDSVPVGTYKTVRFKVGLGEKADVSDSIAILKQTSMWFGSTVADGHTFLNMQGKVDTSTLGDGEIASMQPFKFKIGTKANYKLVEMPARALSVPTNGGFLHLKMDVIRLFTGVDLKSTGSLNITTTADNATEAASRIVNNIPSTFEYEY